MVLGGFVTAGVNEFPQRSERILVLRLVDKLSHVGPYLFVGLWGLLDWTATWSLDFEPPDRELFPALDLGYEVARRGGSCGAAGHVR